MNITDFDRQLFKNRNGKNAGDLSGRVNKIIEDKIYVKNEEEAFCVMENATDEVYVKLESVEADKLSFTDPICTAFIEKRGMYLPDKSINIDYFAYLNDKYEDDISLHSLPWKFDEYLKKLEDRVQSIGNPTIRRFQAFGKFLLFALIGSVVAYLSQLAVFDGHKDFLSLICWVPFLLGLLTLGGCAVTAFYYLFHGAVENYEYNELKNAYLNAMKYVRCRALWFQKTRNTDSVPEYLIVAEGRVRFASEPVKKMIKKLLNIEYNKSADPIADKDLLYDALEDLKESKEDKSFELIKKAEDFEEKGDKENAYLQYIASLKCGDSLALAKACQLACELADENNDLEKIYECVYLADSFGIAEDAFKEDLYEGLHCYYMEQFIPLYQAYNKEGDKVKKNELKRKCDEVKAKLGFCNVMLAWMVHISVVLKYQEELV